MKAHITKEQERLVVDGTAWRRWGPYLSERAWGTVREDYSPDGCAWDYFPHDAARSRAYRWNEDGLAGISDDKGRLCFTLALWNERDPILKERLFGLTGQQGNHGEDVKECYFYLDSTPSHSYMCMLYKYPHSVDTVNFGEADFPFGDFDAILAARMHEADEFYAMLQPASLDDDRRNVQRQALAGMLWSKQFYHYIVEQWLHGDPAQPPPPPQRKYCRNRQWRHLYNERVMSMPDKWEYPWYAAWDLAFHCLQLVLLDSDFAKSQLDLLVREWYMHPNGQLPAYEWSFDDVNPPVFAWAAWRVYKIDQEQTGYSDRMFLESIFHKLLLNFTWWVNRKDSEGNNVFQGGFLLFFSI